MDEIDRKLIELLQMDGKKTLQELAEAVNRPKTTIASRIKKLEEKGYIMGYKAVVNPFLLGYQVLAFVMASVRRGEAAGQKPLQEQLAERILNDCSGKSDLPLVEEAYIITGPYDLLLKVWARDIKQLSSFLVSYLASIPDIQRTETLMVLEIVEDWRRRYMPVASGP
ncbi:Lrp/AsnC family transcriptional regulator [Thermoproteus tenax]|uniref:Transcriptional regulatory protein, asnC family n=1 Tax=Thermoproteus tenax (strain ATCC 35583 / DSM 2078 / JCM 9277 / NBRC 100435 / Kra 1) TaxID=768679 RepID=G4RJP9_THETK|nr:Lrp/AsnC family transcriptional regulator [Thermoproteus tenax]CCC81794.1 transcriptional regulatory protein, asnC family [Thermoproteus tenax Kra 1]